MKPLHKTNYLNHSARSRGARRRSVVSLASVFFIAFCLLIGPIVPFGKNGDSHLSLIAGAIVPSAHASSAYANLATTNVTLNVTAATANLISSNDDWSGISSGEAYEGKNLSPEGTDPQLVLGTEFASLPAAGQTSVAANKGNPSAYNVGGIAEFDSGTELGIGLQGNVTADNPYIVFHLNTTGVSNVYMSYQLKDLDAGSNNASSPVALQYRVGQTGSFTNIPAAYVADATDGPSLSGRITYRSLALPAAVLGQSKVQVRIIATNMAGSDEWVGVNNVRISSLAPTAAPVTLSGRISSSTGMPIARATVEMNDGAGNVRTAISNGFGNYSFTNVPSGVTYIFGIRSKRYTFVSKYEVYTANDNFGGLDFIGYE